MAYESNNPDEQAIRNALDAWRDSALNRADRPEWFWARQRTRISSAIRDHETRRAPKLAWVGIAATVAIAVALFAPARPVKTAPSPQARVEISDHDLMLALERSMNAGVPSSLAPAGMLAQEMDEALVNKVQSQKSKENRYEN